METAGLWVKFHPKRDFREIFIHSGLFTVNDADGRNMDFLQSKIAPNYCYSICLFMSLITR